MQPSFCLWIFMFKMFLYLKKRGLIFLAIFFLFGTVQAEFVSLHQRPISYVERIDYSSGGYIPVYSPPYQGFMKQFSPYGVSGCTIGYESEAGKCETVTGGFGFLFPDYSYAPEFRVYIPPGTTGFSLLGFLPQNEMYAVVVKMDSPPERRAVLSQDEYDQVRSTQHEDTNFSLLLQGQEKIMVHLGGGSTSIAGTFRSKNTPLTTGHWLYARVLNGSSLYNFRANYVVDKNVYKNWWDLAQNSGKFDASFDPLQGDSLPPVIPPLISIAVSPQNWTSGSSPAPSITVSANPANAKIQACEVNQTPLAGLLTFGASTGSSVVGRINEAVAADLPSGTSEITFTCDSKPGKFTINKPVVDPTEPAVGTVTFSNGRTVEESGEFQNEYEMTMTLDLANENIQAGDKVSYWVAALIPFYGPVLPLPDQHTIDLQVPFFLGLTDPDSERRRMWRLLLNENQLANSVYEKNVSPVSSRVENTIQLYISEADLRALGAEIVIGYKITRSNQEGPIKAASGSWRPAPNPTASAALQ